MLERLVYVSTAAPDLTLPIVRRIVARAQIRNRQLDVTGMLLYVHPEFVQVLEARSEVLDEVVAHIAEDPRHRDIRIIERKAITARRFDRWNMGLLVTVALAQAVQALKAGELSVDGLIDAMLVDADLL
ncbi:MAG: BLUF domain-containing protein [Pelomonas sp.]|nr:BLUF domain-containing protein [Roseateles sp.]